MEFKHGTNRLTTCERREHRDSILFANINFVYLKLLFINHDTVNNRLNVKS